MPEFDVHLRRGIIYRTPIDSVKFAHSALKLCRAVGAVKSFKLNGVVLETLFNFYAFFFHYVAEKVHFYEIRLISYLNIR